MTDLVCKIHGVRLEPDEVPISYGLPPAPPRGYYEAMDEFFPNANSFVLGGCVISLDEISSKELFCSACRVAEKAWVESTEGLEDFWNV